MFNTQHVLDKLDLPNSPTAAVVAVGERCRDRGEAEAARIIGIIVPGPWEPADGDDAFVVRMTAQALVEAMVRAGESFDPTMAIILAGERARKFRNNPANKFMFEQDVGTVKDFTVTKDVAGVKVEVKADGKIKKGGKQEAADALYQEHVVNGGKSSSEFLEVLMKQLDMTKAGARTYMYNSKKKHEGK